MHEQTVKTGLSSVFASIGIYALFLIYPLVMHKGYHDITVTRYTVFCMIASVFAVICVIFRIWEADKLSLKAISVKPLDFAVIAFFICSALSTAVSEFSLSSLYGDAGKNMGFIMTAALCAAYFWISSYYELNMKDFELFGISSLLIFAFSFLQFKGIDLFGLLGSLSSTTRINFLSPFGNINVFSGYVCIMAPLSMYMYIFSEEKKKRILWAICSCGGFTALFIANSDSGYLGMGAAFAVALICSCKSIKSFRRYFFLCVLFFINALTFGIINRFFPGTRGLSVITQLFTESLLPVAGLILSSAVFLIVHFRQRKTEKLPRGLKTGFIIFFSVAIITVIGLIIYFSVINISYDLGYFEKFLRFNDAWGTDRGFIWKRLISIFIDAPLINKIFGFGEDTISLLMARYFKDDMLALGYFTDNAHNEYIHRLLSTGICGLLSFIAMIALAVKSVLSKKASVLTAALLLPIISWSVQAVVNITQPISTPFIFIFIALTCCRQSDFSLLAMINIKKRQTANFHKLRKEENIV